MSAKSFEVELHKILDDYSEEVRETIAEIVDEAGQEAAQKLRAKRHGKNDWQKYPKTWTSTTETTRTGVTAHVHNTKNYRLAHLLEFGHAIKSGGRTVGSADAYPHISEVNEEVQKDLDDMIKERLG